MDEASLYKRGSTLKELLKTSLPAAVDLSIQPLLWTYEAALIGRISAAAFAGHGFALQVILFTFTVLLTFNVGSSIIINWHLGKGDSWGANHILGQSMMFGIILSFFLAIVFYTGSPLYFRIIGDEPFAQIAGISYLRMLSYFMPIIITNFIALGIIRGIGDTYYSLITNIVISGINLVFAPLFIFGRLGLPRLEVAGAALAIGIAHSFGLLVTVTLLRSRKCRLFLSFRELTTPKWESIKLLFRKGAPTTVEQLMWAFGQIVVSSWVAQISFVALATHQLLLRIQGVLSMVYWGFSLGAMATVGKSVGAAEHLLAERAGKIAGRMVFLFGVLIVVFVGFQGEWLLRALITDQQVIGLGVSFLWLFAVIQLPKAMNNVTTGNLRGAGELQFLMWIMIGAVMAFEIGASAAVIFLFHFGLAGVWFVHGFDETFRFFLSYTRFRSGKWKILDA